MLSLTREPEQSVVINGNVEVVVLRVRGNKVRLGVHAPRDIPVYRREIYEAMKSRRAVDHEEAKHHFDPVQLAHLKWGVFVDGKVEFVAKNQLLAEVIAKGVYEGSKQKYEVKLIKQ